MSSTTMYIMWYDDRPKITLAQRVADATAAYMRRFRIAPNTALIRPSEAPESVADIPLAVRVVPTINVHTVWVGLEVTP